MRHLALVLAAFLVPYSPLVEAAELPGNKTKIRVQDFFLNAKAKGNRRVVLLPEHGGHPGTDFFIQPYNDGLLVRSYTGKFVKPGRNGVIIVTNLTDPELCKWGKLQIGEGYALTWRGSYLAVRRGKLELVPIPARPAGNAIAVGPVIVAAVVIAAAHCAAPPVAEAPGREPDPPPRPDPPQPPGPPNPPCPPGGCGPD